MEIRGTLHPVSKQRFMRYYVATVLMTIIAMNSFGQSSEKVVPSNWAKDFVIEFTYTGSMDGSRTVAKITYDSCVIEYQAGHKAPVRGFYRMKDSDRSTILKKLQELKADKISSKASPHPVNDGYSRFVRIGDIYLSGGPSYEMTEDSKNRFSEVYQYLEGFALKKTNPK